MIISGSNLFENGYRPDLPARELICVVIKQAVLHAQGLEMDADGKPTNLREGSLRASAVEYLLSEDFELDCADLELPCPPDVFIERVREKITQQTYQIPAFAHPIAHLDIDNSHTQRIGVSALNNKFGKSGCHVREMATELAGAK